MGDGTEPTRTAETNGVRVRKTIDTGPDDTAVVTLEVTADRDDATTVRITEPALETISGDEIELHTEHGAAYWIEGEDATFEREFDAGETYEIVYRVTDVTPARFENLDSDPVVESVPSGLDSVVDREKSDAVRAVIAGERESLTANAPGTTPSSAPADESTSEDVSAPEDVPVDVSAGESATDEPPAHEPPGEEPTEPGDVTDSATDDVEARLAATPSGGVARALLEELREGHVDEETREALRSELEPGQSHDLRIKHLQSEVTEFAAYVEMLETFVDEHGTFDDVLGGVAEDVESLDERVEAVRHEVDDVRDDVGDVRDDVETEVQALAADVDALGDGQEDLAASVDSLEATLESLENRLATFEDRLERFDSFRERLSGALQNPDDDSGY